MFAHEMRLPGAHNSTVVEVMRLSAAARQARCGERARNLSASLKILTHFLTAE